MPKKFLKIFAAGAFLFVAFSGSAHAAPAWWPIVPCGLNQQPAGATLQDDGPNGTKVPHNYTAICNQCDLIVLFKNIIDLVIDVIVPTVGTAIFIGAGFWILVNAHSGKSEAVKQGREYMTNAAIGIAIILCSWMITTAILKTLSNNPNPANPWYQITCRVGALSDLANATLPSIGGNPTTVAPTGTTTGTGQTGTTSTGTGQCLQSGLNLCQGNAPQGCSNSSCSQYSGAINNVVNRVGGLATANVLKAFMETESSCSIAAGSDSSFGLMQLSPATANIYATRCGVPAGSVTQSWLTNPSNVENSICIAAQYINAIGVSQCGPSVRNLYAGYNGGQTGDTSACAPSVSCAGQTDCSGDPVKRWECLYDDTAATACNGGTNLFGGYNQTRQGATRILQCAANPGF